MQKNKRYFSLVIGFFLVLWLCFFLFQQLDLVTADLGRFIKNGEQIFQGNFWGVLNTNFYSFTHTQYPFLNHHWGTGVIFYFIHGIGGFTLLHLFSIFLAIFTFLILFKVAKKEAGLVVATILSIALIPLMAYRKEIRPEVLSCLFSASFIYILWLYRNKEISIRWLWFLPILEILWVNLHIYFFLGPVIIGAFLLEKIIFYLKGQKSFLKPLTIVFSATFLASFVNPFGWKNVFYPFRIYEGRGYLVLEEQSIWFLEKLNINNPSFLLFEFILGLLILSFVWILIKKRKKFPLVNLFLATGFTFMACWSIRNITLFSFMSLPIFAKNIKIIWPCLSFETLNKRILAVSIALTVVFLIFISYGRYLPINNINDFGLGLDNRQNKTISFFQENNLKGPIFNNYDIGGYLIYNLFPQEKVFVDNRPETYPIDFFQDVYIPMQEDSSVWLEKDREYNFNTIIFYRHDATPWGQKFLIDRIQDVNWSPVFVDEKNIVFVKRNDLNQEVINQFEIPQGVFSLK
ncbi:MAG: hypothetical protein U9P50_03425 [Patescibacteria group bacterium]|nr:hypothetical protein [Patescibacteria group bacterium]